MLFWNSYARGQSLHFTALAIAFSDVYFVLPNKNSNHKAIEAWLSFALNPLSFTLYATAGLLAIIWHAFPWDGTRYVMSEVLCVLWTLALTLNWLLLILIVLSRRQQLWNPLLGQLSFQPGPWTLNIEKCVEENLLGYHHCVLSVLESRRSSDIIESQTLLRLRLSSFPFAEWPKSSQAQMFEFCNQCIVMFSIFNTFHLAWNCLCCLSV